MKKKLVVPFFIFLFLFIEGFYALAKGIEKHEIWRIIFASVGIIIGLFFIVVLAIKIFKKERHIRN